MEQFKEIFLSIIETKISDEIDKQIIKEAFASAEVEVALNTLKKSIYGYQR